MAQSIKEQREFKINNFDLLRFLAATEVIFDHYFQHLNIPLTARQSETLYLFPGVPVFFLISGYLISASFERNARFNDYIRNRMLRIYPGLWCCLIVTVIVFSATGVNFLNSQALIWFPCQLVGLIYTPGFLSTYGFGSYNGSLWSIPVELQFYLVLPLLYLILPKKGLNYWFLGILVVFTFINLTYPFHFLKPIVNKTLGFTFIVNFSLFLFGVVFQRFRIYKSDVIYNKALYWVIIYVLFSYIAPGSISPVWFVLFRNLLLGFTVLSLAYTLPEIAKKIMRTNDISYGIYIYHGLVLSVIVQEKWQANVNLFFIIAITYILAYLSWNFVEKPFIHRKKHTIRTTIGY